MRKRWLALGVILLLAIPLVLLLQDFSREVLLVELYRMAWAADILFDTLPQAPTWFIFVLIVAVIAVRSLVRRRQQKRLREQDFVREGQIHMLARWLDRATKGEYFRWNLERHVADLTLAVMAYRQRIPQDEIRQRVRVGGLDAPPEIQAYLRAGNKPAYSTVAGSWLRFRQSPPGERPAQPDPSLEMVVQYLEDQMEVRSDH